MTKNQNKYFEQLDRSDFNTINEYIINLIMLTKILVNLKPSFARTLRPKRIINEAQKTMPSQAQTFNRQMKQADDKINQKIKSLLNSNLKQQQILNKFIPQEQLKPLKQTYDEHEVDIVRQQILLNQITKKYEKNKKQLPIGTRYEKESIAEQEKQQRQKRILERLRKQNPQAKQLTFDDQLKQKYPQQLIKLAEQKLNENKLSQFKQAISHRYLKEEHEKPHNIDLMKRRLRKGQTYKELLQKDRQQGRQKNELKRIKNQQRLQLIQKKKQEKQLNRRQSQQIVQYEDENYYKEKGLKQFQQRQINKNVDEKFLAQGEKDMNESTEKYNILLDQYEEIKENNSFKKYLYDESSFGKMDRKMKDLEERLKNHGIQVDMEELKGMKKDLLFQEKKEREERQQFQKNLMKKEKKKQMKQYYNKIHEQKLREDLDYDKDFKNRFKQIEYDPLDVEANIQKIKELNLQRKALFVNKDPKVQTHFKKTEKNISNFILSCFYQNLLNSNQTYYENIEIKSLYFNEKKTVANVFWAFQDENLSNNEAEKNKIQKKLTKSTGYISGKMTQYLGLRYGPDIRFYYDKILKQTEQIKQGLSKERDQVIEFELNNLLKKGHITSKQQLANTKQKLESIADENIRNYHNREKLLSKKYQKNERNSKKTPNAKKKSADARFWDHLDTL